MKKSIIALTLLTASAAVQAGDRVIMTTPELLLTAGGSYNEVHKSVSIKFTLQETLCYSATNACLNPSIMWLVTDDPDKFDFSDKINIGAGVDIKHKFPKSNNNSMYVEVGPVMFIKKLDRKFNMHIGAGVEYKRFIFSIDKYGVSNGILMLNAGYRL